MQLFGLVNALLYHDKRTENLDLSIRRYAVLPLSPSAGLISWVHNCDTLHDFIRCLSPRIVQYMPNISMQFNDVSGIIARAVRSC
jgi:phosphatidylinositol kinase/protein kinase (PI-3  family)